MQARGPTFEAVLYPNPPLGRNGFLVFAALVSSIICAFGLGFTLIGAWPVGGFMGLELVLVIGAFIWSRRQARRHELIRVDASGLYVRRVDPDGRAMDWRFEPMWARVEMDDPPRPNSHLLLTGEGRRLAIGAFLTPEERLDVARSLREALRRLR